MKEIIVLVSMKEIKDVILQTETMQDEATDNLDFDLSRTEELTYKARGRLNLLKELELLTSDTFVNLVTKQSNLEERLRVEKTLRSRQTT